MVVHSEESQPLPRKLPPPGPVAKAAPVMGTGRLARQDMGLACSLMDDLQYALDGLASASLSVQRQSAARMLAICADPKASVARVAQNADLVVTAIRGAPPAAHGDELLALAFACTLRTLSLDEMCDEAALPELVLCGLERLRPPASAASAPAPASAAFRGKHAGR